MRSDFHAALKHAAEHDLGIDKILGAAQADHPDFRAHGRREPMKALFNGDVVVFFFHEFAVFLDLNGVSVKHSHHDMLAAKFHRAIGW